MKGPRGLLPLPWLPDRRKEREGPVGLGPGGTPSSTIPMVDVSTSPTMSYNTLTLSSPIDPPEGTPPSYVPCFLVKKRVPK